LSFEYIGNDSGLGLQDAIKDSTKTQNYF